MLRSKEEALHNMQNQLRQREAQVFVLEEQTIELLENEDKRLKDKESELRHWERVLKKEVRKRLVSENNLPPDLRGILHISSLHNRDCAGKKDLAKSVKLIIKKRMGSQVVNDGRLKIFSFGFVGSNPTSCNNFFSPFALDSFDNIRNGYR